MAKLKQMSLKKKGKRTVSPKKNKTINSAETRITNGKIKKGKTIPKPLIKKKIIQKQSDNEESDISLDVSDEDVESDVEFNDEDVVGEESDSDDDVEDDASESNNEQAVEERDNNEDATDESGDDEDAEGHKMALKRLKDTDPEFYQYLQENDKKLLNFNLSDEEDDDEKGEDVEDLVHTPGDKLEVASDESDYEPDDEEKQVDSRVITLKMIKQWQCDIQTDKSNKTIICLVRAFNAALRRVSAEEDNEVIYYKVDGSSVFNAVIQLCVLELGPAIRRFLGIQGGSKQPPHKCKKFVKVKKPLKDYFTDLLKLLGGVTSTNILNVLLKHLHYMSSLLVSFQSTTKSLLKKLVSLWGSADESVRVVAFLCILRITHNQQQSLLDSALRMMYMTYVKNSKFVSVNTLPGINFMRRSLIEMYSLDLNVSYEHVFLFIRQLAINLRNAITVNKKENVQTVYNWQFINSLKLWGSLLAATHNKPQLQPLVYPYVQICLGTIKLIPTVQYYPLRFHVVQMLIDLSRDTGVFIPILPFILEVLTGYDFNKKHQKVSMKPLNFICLLRLSKSQMSENGFKDTAIDTVYAQLLEYLSSQSQSIAFPDLALFCKLQIKAFTKKCNVANYQRKLGQINEKIEQNTTFIEQERKRVAFVLTDFKKISAWESTVKNKGTPLNTFYENWNKMRVIKKKKEVSNNEALGDYNLPKLKKVRRDTRKEDEGEVVLFPSDSEDDNVGFGEGKEKKMKRGKRGGKNVNKKLVVGAVDMNIDAVGDDIVQELNMSEW